MTRNRKPIWIVLGWAFIALAIAGIFLPIVPQIPFAIIGAFCFSKGSPRLHHWVLNSKYFGAAVRDWEMDHVIRKRLKLISIAMMIGGAGLAYWRYHQDKPKIAITVPVLFACASLFVATRRSRTRFPAAP